MSTYQENKQYRIFMCIILVLIQIIIHRYMNVLRLNLDLMYLILVYISVKPGFKQSLFTGAGIGLVTDYFSMNIMGVFGFSRTLAAFFLHESSAHIDLKNNSFVFFFIALSLSLSNGIANLFLYWVRDISFSWNLVIYQPILTSIAAMLLLSTVVSKEDDLDVY